MKADTKLRALTVEDSKTKSSAQYVVLRNDANAAL